MRYVVVGYGNIGRMRARILGDRCVATVDPIAPGARHRALAEVDPGSYEAVVVATPNEMKLDYVRASLAAGKSVLVEKPLLLASLREGEGLAQAARGGAIWRTSYNLRHEPLIGRLASLTADNAIGKVDRVRMLYGNGTVRNWIGTWRESGSGVLEDLACHLIDLCPVLGLRDSEFSLLDARAVESRTYDYALFTTLDRRAVFEVGNLFWKNLFAVDLYGATGSLHLRGLGKWEGVTLTHHRRVYPSGAPETSVVSTPPADPTWELDLEDFERMVSAGTHSLANDWRVSSAVASLVSQARG